MLPVECPVTRLRALSGVERLWIVGERLAPPFANQIVIEGAGPGLPSLARIQEAVASLEDRIPLLRSQRTGRGRSTEWTSGGSGPVVRSVDGGAWEGRSQRGAPFLLSPPGSSSSAPVEVLLVEATKPRIVFRTRHAAADGRGTLLLAEAVLGFLRGEEVAPCPAGPLTDFEIAEETGRSAEVSPVRDQQAVIAARPVHDGATAASLPAGEMSESMSWARVTLRPGLRSPMATLLSVLAARAERVIRLDVPVDMRRHRPGLRSTANLTGLLRVEVSPDDSIDEIRTEIRGRLERAEEADFVLSAARLCGVPLWLMTLVGRHSLRTSQKTGVFETSGTVSNLGRLEMSRFSYDEFTAERVFFIPPGSPGLPFFATLTGGPLGVELCAAVPEWLLAGEDLGEQLERLATELAELG